MKKITRAFNEKPIDQLKKDGQSLKDEIIKLKLEMKTNPPKDTNLLFKKRKQLAVILTLITQKSQK